MMQQVMTIANEQVDRAIAEDSILLKTSADDSSERVIVRKFLAEADDIEDDWRKVRSESVKTLGPVLGDDLAIVAIEKLRDKLMKLAWQKVREVRAQEEELLGGVHQGMGQLALVVDHVLKWTSASQERWKAELNSWLGLLKTGSLTQMELVLTLMADINTFVRDLRLDFRRAQKIGSPTESISKQLSSALATLTFLRNPLLQLAHLSKTRLGDLGGDISLLYESFGESMDDLDSAAFLDSALLITEEDLEAAMKAAEEMKGQRMSAVSGMSGGSRSSVRELGERNSLRISQAGLSGRSATSSPPPPTDNAPSPLLSQTSKQSQREERTLRIETTKPKGKLGKLVNLWESHPEFESQHITSPTSPSRSLSTIASPSVPSRIDKPDLVKEVKDVTKETVVETKSPTIGKLESMVSLWESQPGVGTALLPGEKSAAEKERQKTPLSSKPLK